MAEKQWVVFHFIGWSKSGKTKIWAVRPTGDADISLGHVVWFAPWRQYNFEPNHFNVMTFNADCLRQIARFLDDENRLHRSDRAGRVVREQLTGANDYSPLVPPGL